MKEQTRNIHLGNHFTVSDEMLRRIAKTAADKPLIDIFLFGKPIAFTGDNSMPEEINTYGNEYRLEFKFGSSFSNHYRATAFESWNVMLYRNIFIDLIIYIQKLLKDKGEITDIIEITFDDSDTYETISSGSHLGLGFLEKISNDETQGIDCFNSFSSRFPEYKSKHTLYLSYLLAYLKTHYPVEFLTAYLFLSYSYLPSLLDATSELGNTLCSDQKREQLIAQFRNKTGFVYPGRYVVWTRSHE